MDVISFGRNASGPLNGLIFAPVELYTHLNASLVYKIGPPRVILVYFYEGNDLNDAFYELEMSPGESGSLRSQALVEDAVLEMESARTGIETPRWQGNIGLLVTAGRMFRSILHGARFSTGQMDDHELDIDRWRQGAVNRALIAGEETSVPDGLQSPSLELTDMDDHKMPRVGQWRPGSVNRVLIAGEEISIPDRLQSPSLELTDEEVNAAVRVFRYALGRLSSFFPAARIVVVYIPSPLSSYELASDEVRIETYHSGEDTYDARSVYSRSDYIKARIQRAAEDAGHAFADAQETVRELGQERLVHGPGDWHHFNSDGYRALATAIIPHLAE